MSQQHRAGPRIGRSAMVSPGAVTARSADRERFAQEPAVSKFVYDDFTDSAASFINLATSSG